MTNYDNKRSQQRQEQINRFAAYLSKQMGQRQRIFRHTHILVKADSAQDERVQAMRVWAVETLKSCGTTTQLGDIVDVCTRKDGHQGEHGSLPFINNVLPTPGLEL